MIISFEGQDGSGKSTIINILEIQLLEMGKTVCVLKTPDKCFDKMRMDVDNSNLLGLSFDFYEMSLKYTNIFLKTNMDKFDFILIDRYYYSTFVSHTYKGLNIPPDYFTFMIEPHLSIFLNVSNQSRQKRIIGRNNSVHDFLSLDVNVEITAKKLYETFDFIIIENEGNINETISSIWRLINEKCT